MSPSEVAASCGGSRTEAGRGHGQTWQKGSGGWADGRQVGGTNDVEHLAGGQRFVSPAPTCLIC